jgi:hypothetical protein
MKRMIAFLGFGLVLITGVAVAQQQPPAQPSPERGHQHMQGGMCPMMSGMMGAGMMGGIEMRAQLGLRSGCDHKLRTTALRTTSRNGTQGA